MWVPVGVDFVECFQSNCWFFRGRPGANLPLSRTGHQISRIKSSFELFCALVRHLAQFKLKTSIFLIRSAVSGAFLHVFSHWQRLFLGSKRWLRNLTVCTSCKTSYICPKSFPLGSGWVGRGGPLKFRGVVKNLNLKSKYRYVGKIVWDITPRGWHLWIRFVCK